MNIIRIEGDIGTAVTAAQVRAELEASRGNGRPLIRINSQGGSVQEGVAIYSELVRWAGGVDTEVSGWALSIASLILMAGVGRAMAETSLVMVHAPWVNGGGNAQELRTTAQQLEVVAESMKTAYVRAGCARALVTNWLAGGDHWFTAAEAKAVGLITQVMAPVGAEAVSREAFASCRHPIPQRLLGSITMPQASTTQPSTEAIRAEGVRAEAARQRDIRAAFSPYLSSEGVPNATALMEAALADPGVTVEGAKLKLLQAMGAGSSPVGGHYYVSTEAPDRMKTFLAAATDALVMRAGIRVEEPHPAIKDMQRLGICGMAERVLSMRGQSTAGMSPSQILAGAMTTSDFPSLLGATVNKSLRAGYQSAPATFRGWTGEREVPDFKKSSLVAMSEAPGLLEVAEGADYKFGALNDSAATYQVKTYGRIINITRQALINDDTSAFTSLPAAIGATAVRLEADAVYSLLTSNPTLSDSVALFHATHGNLSGAASLDLTALGAARAAMRKQKGLLGSEYLDVQPRFLIVPVAMETTAEQLLRSLVDPSKNNDTPNVEWVRGLELVADPRLDADSATKWYLAASPVQIEGVVRAYLQGQDRPHVEQNEEWTRDVVSFKGRLDLGSCIVDYRALHRVG